MSYTPQTTRYDQMLYKRCGRSGLQLPALSLGLWHNFGGIDNFETCREITTTAFDRGITHFDLANNYGPPPGSAEETFGKILKSDLGPFRDELIISSKAGYLMWPGPYGEWGSKKYLQASLDQSLKRMGLEYVDIFYSHRFDPETPLEETMCALDLMVRQGKALYVGISNYSPTQTDQAATILNELGTPCLIHQPKYSMLQRIPEEGLFETLDKHGIGAIAYSPLAQGLLTNKYLNGIPEDSRAKRPEGFLQESEINPQLIDKLRRLNEMAQSRGQSLAQMAICWILRKPTVTSVLIGARSVPQLEDNLESLSNIEISPDELSQIDQILN